MKIYLLEKLVNGNFSDLEDTYKEDEADNPPQHELTEGKPTSFTTIIYISKPQY